MSGGRWMRAMPHVAGAAFGLVATGAAAQTFSIPFVVDFEAAAYAPFYAFAADKLAGQVTDGRLEVESAAKPGNCRIASVMLGTAEDVHASYVAVTVQPGASAAGGALMHGAGLAIRYGEGEATRFYALLLGAAGYDIVAFDNGKVGQRLRAALPERGADPVRIAARETGGGAEFFVDGKSVGSLSDSRIAGSSVALIHCGPGRFTFDDWGLNSKGDAGLGE